ncbi:MAG: TOBE domain-containing protein [Spirochaetales bacterium]|nr:TOBE domain-containing protein [Spirochaetales bacterium]
MVTHDQNEALTVSDRMAVMKDGLIAQMGSAKEVFSTPRSVFVADFLGMENIIDAEPLNDHTARTALGEFAVSQKMPIVPCKVGIRPEDIVISGAAGPNTIESIVDTVIYQGAQQLILTGNGLHVRINGSTSLAAGDRVHLQFPADSLVVLYE